MRRGCLGLAAVTTSLATAAAFSPLSPAAVHGRHVVSPRTNAAATRLVHKDVAALAVDYAHGRYRAVCASLAASARTRLGGSSSCAVKVAALHAFFPVRRLTIVTVAFRKKRTLAVVAAALNGSRKRILRAAFDWEAGMYRLAANISPIPTG